MLQNEIQESEELQEYEYDSTQNNNESIEPLPTLSSVFDMSVEELLAEIREIKKERLL